MQSNDMRIFMRINTRDWKNGPYTQARSQDLEKGGAILKE